MAKSCITIEKSTPNALQHNDRTNAPDYLMQERIGNYSFNRSAEEAQALYQELRKEAFGNYTKRTGQKVQTAEDKMRWSAVVNLNANHTLEDVQNLADKLCEKYGWQEIQVAVHLDEGHKNERDVIVLNRHAHIEFFMLDKQGIFQFKKRDFGKKQMAEMQTFVADTLEMERGQSKLETKRERLSHRQYKQHAQAVQKARQETKQELGYDFREMQKRITALEISSAEKKELHAENSELRKIIKSKDGTIEEQAQRIALLERKLEELTEYKKAFKYIATELQIPKMQDGKYEVSAVKEHIQEVKIVKERSYQATITSQKTLKNQREEANALKAQVSTLERENVDLRANVRVLEQEKEELKEENSKLKEIVDKVSSFFSATRDTLVSRVTSFFKSKSSTQSLSSPPIKTHAEHAPSASAASIEDIFLDPDVQSQKDARQRIQDLMNDLDEVKRLKI